MSPDSESEVWFKDELMANYDAFVTEHAKLSQTDKERVQKALGSENYLLSKVRLHFAWTDLSAEGKVEAMTALKGISELAGVFSGESAKTAACPEAEKKDAAKTPIKEKKSKEGKKKDKKNGDEDKKEPVYRVKQKNSDKPADKENPEKKEEKAKDAEVPADVKDMLADLQKFCRTHHAVIEPPRKRKGGKTDDVDFLRRENESLRDKLKAVSEEGKEAKETKK